MLPPCSSSPSFGAGPHRPPARDGPHRRSALGARPPPPGAQLEARPAVMIVISVQVRQSSGQSAPVDSSHFDLELIGRSFGAMSKQRHCDAR